MTNEEAIKRLKSDIYEYADFTENPNENEFWTAFDMAIKALEVADLDGYSSRLWKAAYERGKAEAEPRWIPVSERLPEEYKRVIVSDIIGIYIGEFIGAEENWGEKHFIFINEHGMRSKSAKAWMPLPEPMKVGEEV